MADDLRHCPRCGSPAGSDETYCYQCGSPLDAPAGPSGGGAGESTAAPGPAQPSGRPFGSRYLLTRVIGHGAMGEVWRASTREGEQVAIKILRPDLAADEALVSKFLQERQVLTRLTGRNLVRVHDLVAEGGTLGIVMDLIDGPDLRTELERRGTFSPEVAVLLTVGLLEGLAVVHAAGVVHGDVKPENLLLSDSDGLAIPRLTDFGIARLSDSDAVRRHTSVVGTPEYMAPEVADGRPASPASDIYSAGIVLYELLCGVTPFVGGSPVAVLRRHVEQVPGRPPGVPEALWSHIVSMLAKDPANRPSSAAQLAASLAGTVPTLGGLPPLAPLVVPPAVVSDSRETTVVGMAELSAAAGPEASGEDEVRPRAVPAQRARPGRRRLFVGVAVGTVILLGIAGAATALALKRNPTTVAAGHNPVASISASSSPSESPSPSASASSSPSASASPTPTIDEGVVPDVVGMDLTTATTALLNAGLQTSTTDVVDGTKPNGTIVAQTPTAGTVGATAVTISVARPPSVTFLSDLSPVAGSMDKGLQTVNGQVLTHSIASTADCSGNPREVEYDLGRTFIRLNATAGLDDTSASDGKVLFEVFADGRSVFNKTLALGEVASVDVDMTGVLRLKLSTTWVGPTSGWCNVSTGAVWGNASITGLPRPASSPSPGS